MECEYCKKIFERKQVLLRHQKTAEFCLKIQKGHAKFECVFCKRQLSTKQRLETHLEICKFKKLKPVDLGLMEKVSSNLKIEDILLGIDGYVKYALEHPLKDRIVCTDVSRKTIKYKDKEGNIITDYKCKNIVPLLFKSIKEANKIIGREYLDEANDEEFALLLEQRIDIINASSGLSSKFSKKIARSIALNSK